MNIYALVVSVPFDKYSRGDVISDADAVAALLETHPQFVGKVKLPRKAPERAAKNTKDKEPE